MALTPAIMASNLPRVVPGTPLRAIAALSRADRTAGRALRHAGERVPAAAAVARAVARGLSPAFRGIVGALVLARPCRAVGIAALAAGVAAGLTARVLRDRVDRRRPGARHEGGFPSRHAAAATAIARAVGRRRPALGAALWGAAAIGLTGRVLTSDHDPADIAAGVVVGLATEAAVAALMPER